MAHQLGDHDDVDAGAQQVGAEGVPQGVRGGERLARLIDQVGVGGEFVEELVDGAGGEPAAAAVEEQRRRVGAGPALAVFLPADLSPTPSRVPGDTSLTDTPNCRRRSWW